MNKRGFLLGMLAAGAAPAIVKAANIMPVFARTESGLLAPLQKFVVTSVEPGNMMLIPAIITREALRIPQNNLAFTRVGSGVASDFKIGDIITFAR